MLTLPYRDDDAERAGSSKGGVADIAANAKRSHILAVRRDAWTIFGGGIGPCHGLKLDKGDDVEVEGTSDALGVATLIDEAEGIPEP